MDNPLTLTDYFALSPMIIILIGALIVLLCESFIPSATHRFALWGVLAVFVIAIAVAYHAPESHNKLLTPWLRFDGLAKFFNIFFLLIGVATTFLGWAFFQRFVATRGEYYFLLMSSVIGLMLIGAAADFLTLFLGLETLSIALYILCSYMKQWKFAQEASIKYFLIGSLAAAFLLYGIALIYGAVGTTNFSALLAGYQHIGTPGNQTLFLSGVALVTLGLAFKAAIVPFHVWAPDVYDGAPTPVTGFMAVGTKVGAFAALAIIFLKFLPQFNPIWNRGIAWLAFPTLIYANYVALRQTQLRRFFAYSGISHAGFLLIPLAVGTEQAMPALLFYLSVYALATLGAFAVLAFLDQRSEGVMLVDLYGLFKRSPWLAAILSVCLLTLTGAPPLAGFFAKLFVFKLALEAGYYALVVVGLLTTILSAYYYLRIIGIMFSEAPSQATSPIRSYSAAIVGVSCLLGILILSCYPAPFMHLLAYVSAP